MERTGNTIGAEGRRQHNEDDPQNGDKPQMQERLADREIKEGLEEIEESRAEGTEETEGRETERRQTSESLETSPQADGVPEDENVGNPEDTEPAANAREEDTGNRA